MKLESVYGIHAVTTLLQRSPDQVVEIWVQKGRVDAKMQKILDLAEAEGLSVMEADKGLLNQKAEGNHQGIVALRKPVQGKSEKHLPDILDNITGDPFVLILDGVTDPHNLGAVLRTADAAGIHLVIAPKDKSAPLTAVAAKVACGAAEAVPYIQVTNLARTMKDLQERGIWIIGTAGEATTTIYQQDCKGPLALVMGAEGPGMRRLTREHCDHLVKIPMAGEVSSLNVSVATGVCLFEAVRQRGGASGKTSG
ncbi:MAG: 23S rRNA (guanosine(2251)-2'-O)-methyltransferase RlmB [Pseudomonadota bacterium]|nr:23S rRNA (guanosine(2251)-2'-O)-methyltransferase RlmB [Oleibacter sp. HI0075]MED5440141.1 23S rRNA (guanosine(2251)-2'-O)-methyltransferase RlmB [Pseudomonadota bacterium]MEE3160772.1 23S rRNA (guanosine(2251)-2'-O)-methyltransferase RlmB [Pseudomonadota bacterium]MEE3189940.1 23S rRNA (guanosine(2251)-2'-O)-methyltransferase RlmB [Pseudomonadota bacterium]|tara:strand:+ start:2847 stop:3605 length:759 start_codon:yes stop_codon:yes gene_type:complete